MAAEPTPMIITIDSDIDSTNNTNNTNNNNNTTIIDNTDILSLAERVADIDPTPNENPIPDMEDVPLLSVKDAIEYAQQRDVELGRKNMRHFVMCADMFAKRLLGNNGAAEVLTIDEIASIHLYTQESPFYAIFNARMRDQNRHRVKPFLPFLKLMLTALYKLPVVSGVTLYRGIKGDLRSTFTAQSAQIWWGINSTTRKVEVLDKFLGTEEGKRTMLHINVHTAYDITKYSAVGNTEHEVILPPGSVIEVESIATPSADLCIVQLKQQEYHKLLGGAGAGGAGASTGVKHDMCPTHAGELMKTFCTICNVAVCQECIVENHGGHILKKVTALLGQKKAFLVKHVANAKTAKARIENGVINVKTNIAGIKKAQQRMLGDVRARILSIRKELDELEKRMEGGVNDECNKQVMELEQQQNELMAAVKTMENTIIVHEPAVNAPSIQVIADATTALVTATKNITRMRATPCNGNGNEAQIVGADDENLKAVVTAIQNATRCVGFQPSNMWGFRAWPCIDRARRDSIGASTSASPGPSAGFGVAGAGIVIGGGVPTTLQTTIPKDKDCTIDRELLSAGCGKIASDSRLSVYNYANSASGVIQKIMGQNHFL